MEAFSDTECHNFTVQNIKTDIFILDLRTKRTESRYRLTGEVLILLGTVVLIDNFNSIHTDT